MQFPSYLAIEAALFCCAALVFPILAGKRLQVMGYQRERAARFTHVFIWVWFTSGCLESILQNMARCPGHPWKTLNFFISLPGCPSLSLHPGPVPMLIGGLVLCSFLSVHPLEALDSIGLYIPPAFALSRIAHLLSGCDWARHVSMNLCGLHLNFLNPLPLYAVAVDIGVYFFLRRLNTAVYSSQRTRERYRGTVIGACLMLHGSTGAIWGVFTAEDKWILDLTPTQFAAVICLLCSLVILSWVFWSHRVPAAKPQTTAAQGAKDPERLLTAAGLTASYLLVVFLIFYLTRQIRVWKWPIQPVSSLSDAYGRIIYYLPVMLIPAGALALLKKCREPLKPWFRWNRFSYLFLITLAASIGYAVYLLVFRQPRLRGAAFWPPVVVLSLMNACSEEIMYRLALYRMIRRAHYSDRTAAIVQSLAYALIHFMVLGAVTGLLSLFYGYLLGMLVKRSNSIGPAIACHFVIDIGCIGMPLLRV